MYTAQQALRAYRQVEHQGVSGEQLYLQGLNGILEYLRRAEGAITSGDNAGKVAALDKAYRIVEHLLAILPADAAKEPDGLSATLERVYTGLLTQLSQANIFNDLEALGQCRTAVSTLKEAWLASGE